MRVCVCVRVCLMSHERRQTLQVCVRVCVCEGVCEGVSNES